MNIDDIVRAHERAGGFFFSPDTMRFFRSRLTSIVEQGETLTFFVVSNGPPYGGREYAVCAYDPTTPRSIRRFGTFSTRGRAATAAKQFARLAEVDLANVKV